MRLTAKSLSITPKIKLNRQIIGLVTILGMLIPSFLNARIDYFGFYNIVDDNFGADYLSEMKGANNVALIYYENIVDFQSLADRLRQQGYKGAILFLSRFDETLLTNTSNHRINYLREVKKKVSQDSDFAKLILQIDLAEEVYFSLEPATGGMNDWEIFRGLTKDQQYAKLKQELEGYVADVNKYFPGVPTAMVTTDWHHAPPSNLDRLGMDSYFFPSTSECDADQRHWFDLQPVPHVARAKQWGNPVFIIGGLYSFQQPIQSRMLSRCQIDWYMDLVKNDPQIVGLLWYAYSSFGGGGSGRVWQGLRESPDTSLIPHVRQIGQQVLSVAVPFIPNNNLALRGAIESVTDGIVSGWAYDPDHPNSSVDVKLYFDLDPYNTPQNDKVIGSVTANVSRPDINSRFNISGNHGFSFVLPDKYRDGRAHAVYAFGIDSDDPSGYSNLELGTYKLFTLSTPGNFTTQNVAWANAVGVSVNTNNITHNVTSGWGNAGAVSTQSISGDGYVEFSTNEISTYKMAGLSHDDPNRDYTSIDYGIFLNIDGNAYIYENGAFRGGIGAYVPGDIFRVGVVGGQVQYFKNGVQLTASVQAPIYPLFFDTAIYGNGGTITNVKINFISIPSVTPSPTPTPSLSPTPSPTSTPRPSITPAPLPTPRSTPTPPSSPSPTPSPYPSTSPTPRIKLMRSISSPRVYYITEKGLKRWIPTERVFLSYGNRWQDIVTVPQSQLDSTPDNILIKLPSSERVYKLENGKKRWISSVATFNRNGFAWDKIAPVNQTEFDYYPLGVTIR